MGREGSECFQATPGAGDRGPKPLPTSPQPLLPIPEVRGRKNTKCRVRWPGTKSCFCQQLPGRCPGRYTVSLSASAFPSAKWEWFESKPDRASVGVRSRISEPEASRARWWGENSSCTTGHSVICHCWPVGQLSWGDGVKSQVPDSHSDSRHLLRALYISGPVPRALCPRAG